MPRLFLILIAVFFITTIIGGYAFDWSWTGYSVNDTLWDWLNLVLLPVTIAFLPLWVATRKTHRVHWETILILVFAAFVVSLIGGYYFNWRWTGYQHNTLWDWIKLLFVPAVIPLVVMWLQREDEEADHRSTSQNPRSPSHQP